MRTALSAECRKIKGRRIWLIVCLLIGVQVLWSAWGARRMDEKDLMQGWMFYLYQYPLLNSIMMPIVAAVVASRLVDIEHKGESFKLLETLMPAERLFDAKFFVGSAYMAFVAAAQVIAIVAIGLMVGFHGVPPASKLILYGLFTLCGSMMLFAFQETLSFRFKNQMIALAVGIFGSFVGLFLLYFPPVFSKFLLWGCYGSLMQVGMNWDVETRVVDYFYTPVEWGSFVFVVCALAAILLIGRTLVKKREV